MRGRSRGAAAAGVELEEGAEEDSESGGGWR